MELVGGIKEEFDFVKSEAVEITADDIADYDGDKTSFEVPKSPRVKEEVVSSKKIKAVEDKRVKNVDTPEILVLNNVVGVRVSPKDIERRDDSRYYCLICNTYSSKTYNTTKRHIGKKHLNLTQGMKQCPHCPYQTPWSLAPHMLFNHMDPSKIDWVYCAQCDLKFRKKSLLQRHIKNIHLQMVQWRPCEICQRNFKTSYALKRHIENVHDRNMDKFKCKDCDFKTRYKQMLNNHFMRDHMDHDDLKTLECSKCNFKTKYRPELHRHTRNRHNIRTFQCHQCGFRSRNELSMKLHMIYHKEDKGSDLRFKCPECAYKTYRAYSFQVHLLTHKKPEELSMFRCYHCPFESKRKDNLKTHIFKHDVFKTALSCAHCDYQTRSKEALAKHLRGHEK